MQVKDVMTRTTEAISPDATLEEASGRMKALNVTMLPVQAGQQVVGVITGHDISVRGIAHGLDPRTTVVGDVMTPGVLSCFEDQAAAEAAGKMAIYGVHRLVVLDRPKRFVGTVSLDELVAYMDRSALTGPTLARSLSQEPPATGFRRILVALDGSDFAERILPKVQSLAEQFGSTVTLIQAVTPVTRPALAELSQGVVTEDWSRGDTPPVAEEMRKHARSYLAGVREALEARGLIVESDCTEGEASEAILRRAREIGADLIAITTHGRTGVDRTLFGSVAEEVLRHAPCPVLLVRVHDARSGDRTKSVGSRSTAHP